MYAHRAETQRIGSLKDAFGLDPVGMQVLIRETIREALGLPLTEANTAGLPPVSMHSPNAPEPPPEQQAA